MVKCSKLCAGDFDQVVKLQRPTRPPNGSGGFKNEVWDDVVDLFCSIKQNRGTEPFAHQRIETRAPFVFHCNYTEDIFETDRLVLEDGTELNIRYIDDLERRKLYLEIGADKGVMD